MLQHAAAESWNGMTIATKETEKLPSGPAVIPPGFYRELIRLAFPIALQSFLLAAVSASDTMMLVRLSQNAMSAVSLASHVQFVQNMLLMVITGAGMILGAQYYGKGDAEAIKALKNIMLRLGAATSVLFFLLCMLMPRSIMDIFTNQEELIQIGARYLRFAAFSYLLTGISQVYLTMMKINRRPGRSARISAIAVVLNIALNYALIFGLGPIPALGVPGAAISTATARVVELGLAILLSPREGELKQRLGQLKSRSSTLSRDFVRVSLPLLGGLFVWGLGFTVYSVITGHMGKEVAAAAAVANVVRDLMCCTCEGTSAAAGIMVGNQLGAGNLALGKAYGERLLRISLVIGLISCVLVLAVLPPARRLSMLSDEAVGHLDKMLIIISVYMIARSANGIVINGIFASGGDTVFNMYSLATCMWGIAIPLSALGAFVFNWPVWLVYACTCLDEVGKIPWVLAHYKKYQWVRNLTRETLY